MELSELMARIGSDNIPALNVWFGEEQKILDMYIKQLSSQYVHTPVTAVSQLVSQLGRKSLDKRRKIYIISNDEHFLKAEESWEKVNKMIDNSHHILILRYYNIDKRGKFYNRFKDIAVEFVRLQDTILTQYIQRDVNLNDDYCTKLIQVCNNDYGRILLEVDKLKHHMEYNSIDANTSFQELINQDMIYTEIGDITFELTDAILGGFVEKAIIKLDEAKRKNEPPIMIASILYNGFRNMVAYQGLGSNKQNANERTGLTGWQIKQCINWSGGYNMQELIRNMLTCQRIESALKTGQLDTDIALDYIVSQCIK